MARKIFFLDIDGTLVNSDKRITPRTLSALRAYLDAGNLMVFASGRAFASVFPLIKAYDLPVDSCYAICCNGAQIYDCGSGKMIRSLGIDKADMEEILDLADAHALHCQAYGPDYIVARSRNENSDHYLSVFPMLSMYVTDRVSERLDAPTAKLLSIELKDPEKFVPFREKLMERFGDRYTAMHSNPTYLEIIPVEAGKGKALIWLCNHLGIPISDSLAAGDEQNDVPMLEAAGFSIAMKNASEGAKKAATVVSEADNDHDGLVPYFLSAAGLEK